MFTVHDHDGKPEWITLNLYIMTVIVLLNC